MSTTALQKTVIVEPECRGGAAPNVRADSVTKRGGNGGYVSWVLENLKGDQNLTQVASRLKKNSDSAAAHMKNLDAALARGDQSEAIDQARALADSTGRLGAMRLMKLAIALQLVSRHGLMERARELFTELEGEYQVFKENLIQDVG